MTKLIFSNNKIGNNGIAHIATTLQKNTTMRELRINGCSISDEGAKSLARALAVNRSLQCGHQFSVLSWWCFSEE